MKLGGIMVVQTDINRDAHCLSENQLGKRKADRVANCERFTCATQLLRYLPRKPLLRLCISAEKERCGLNILAATERQALALT